MSAISELEPKEVFAFFEKLCGIPHGSGNIDAISDYLVNFAKERELTYYQDELKNVIITKPATFGYENEPAVIIQGHMDMVTVQEPGCTFNMEKDSLDVTHEGDYVYAKGTSLGGDDGIAVAYALAVLDSDSIPHPPLEVVITVEEEVGMEGATGIDISMLKGRKLLNIDSEEEGILTVSCAGGVRVHVTLPVTREICCGTEYELEIGGLQGGHSGTSIDKGRGNSNVLFGRVLHKLEKVVDVRIVTAAGGSKDNAIAVKTNITFLVPKESQTTFEDTIKNLEQKLRKEYLGKDDDLELILHQRGSKSEKSLSRKSMSGIANMLYLTPDGVQSMSGTMKGLVETSLNLGILSLNDYAMEMDYSVRSSVDSAKEYIKDKIINMAELFGGMTSEHGEYPSWEYKSDSVLREQMVRIYSEMFDKKPQIEAVHAGLECGILAAKLPGLDCVSFGPDILDIHTTKEKLSISSTERMWGYLLRILAEKQQSREDYE